MYSDISDSERPALAQEWPANSLQIIGLCFVQDRPMVLVCELRPSKKSSIGYKWRQGESCLHSNGQGHIRKGDIYQSFLLLHRSRHPPLSSGLTYPQSFSLETTHPRFGESNIILNPYWEGANEIPISLSQDIDSLVERREYYSITLPLHIYHSETFFPKRVKW